MFSNSFPDRDAMAAMTADMLLEVRAVNFRPADPYTLTSGLASPVYIDCRALISYPQVRDTLMDFAVATLLRDVGFQAFDAVAGGETAGIPFAAWIAQKMGLPMQYVRKKPKGFGRDARIEGRLHDDQRVLLVEDLTTDGGSKVRFAEAIREAGAVCDHTVVVFFYDIFPGTRDAMASHGLTLHALATWRDVLAAARRRESFDAGTLAEVEAFLAEPLAWSGRNGGATEILSGQKAGGMDGS
ncbi:orotate phosphoribosyltransferase [Jannaschia sp. LMIT008]|uniref:orotate phosphoribosyltransferase n=1 Tax=Jannaschia maritima TaxID=3032585 RepID=UPI002811CA35|nr:orotate phosphoribosyltransferase [Jannaschia sp. LMIT008]